MPHIVVEYSDNLPSGLDMQELVNTLHGTLTAQGIDAVRIKARAEEFEYYSVSDQGKRGTMVHIVLSLLQGPDADTLKTYGDVLYGAACDKVKACAPDCNVTMEIREMDREFYWK